MNLQPWHLLTVSLGATLLLIAVVVGLRVRQRRRESTGEPANGADGVVCPECRAENERGYQYCRECTGELPSRPPGAAATAETTSGGLF